MTLPKQYNFMMITMAKTAMEIDREETLFGGGDGFTKDQLKEQLLSREACMIRVRDMLVETMEDSD